MVKIVKPGLAPYLPILRADFPHTAPVLTGYLCMGAAMGILLAAKGFHPLWATLMGIVVYAGSGQFVAVGLLNGLYGLVAGNSADRVTRVRKAVYTAAPAVQGRQNT